jgi:hypothetical protein
MQTNLLTILYFLFLKFLFLLTNPSFDIDFEFALTEIVFVFI